LRRLADRYVVRAALAVANGEAVPEVVSAAFEKLPHVMARADSQSGRIDRAVIDLAEAVLLAGREGEVFAGTVVDVDDRGAQVQFNDYPVVVRVAAPGVVPGEPLDVELDAVDVAKRTTHFVPVARIGARAAS
jgi:exoribonuclease R